MTKFIILDRQKGKTTQLIKMADNYDGYIVCANREIAKYTADMARKMGAKIHFPMTIREILKGKYYPHGVKKIYIDNLDLMLHEIAPGLITAAVTLTPSTPLSNDQES